MARKKSKQDPADRTEFLLSADNWEKFQAALDAPVRDMPRLKAHLSQPRFFDDPAQRRLATLAEVLETDLAPLESFLDLLGEEPMTDRRIADAQHVLGLCTPVLSHLRFPEFGGGPSYGKELLATWQKRQADVQDALMEEINAEIHEVRRARRKPQAEVIALSPEDSATFAESLIDPPPLAPALERAMKRRAGLLSPTIKESLMVEPKSKPKKKGK